MPEQERMSSDDAAGQAMTRAMISHVREYTYCLISEGEKIGTGVAVELPGRYFLATAGHVIPRYGGDIKVLLRNQPTLAVSEFVARRWDHTLDIGLLEIAPTDAPRFRFVTVDAMSLDFDSEEELPTMVLGFPGQFVCPMGELNLTTDAVLRMVLCNALGYHTNLLQQSTWPIHELLDESLHSRQFTDDDLLLDYDPEPTVRSFGPQTAGADTAEVACDPLDPHGMSGGGIWLGQVASTGAGIVSPSPRLIGLQVGWLRERGLLHGIRLGAWLDWVRREYRDLTGTV